MTNVVDMVFLTLRTVPCEDITDYKSSNVFKGTSNNACYPSQQPGYPPSQPGYPPSQPGYPPSQPGYPPPQQGYPSPQQGYPGGPSAQTGYPQPSYSPGYGSRSSGPEPRNITPSVGVHLPDNSDETAPFTSASFSDKAIRRAFIRKVYLVLMCQLGVTVCFIAVFLFVRPVKQWVTRNSWFYFVSYGIFLVTYIALVCCPSVRRKTPGNFICLSVFTLAFSYMTATISSFHDTNIVLIAAGITAGVCLSVTIFAMQTRIDFTMCYGLMLVLSMVLFFMGLAMMIVYFTIGYSHILQCVYAGIAALILCVFLIFDTQMIMGGRKHALSPEEYIFGALQLYLDIVYLFLMILTLVSGGKSSN